MDAKHRDLQNGEQILIGDEYYRSGTWVALNEQMYRDWAGTYSHYVEGILYPMRRNMVVSSEFVNLTEQIYEQVTSGIFSKDKYESR